MFPNLLLGVGSGTPFFFSTNSRPCKQRKVKTLLLKCISRGRISHPGSKLAWKCALILLYGHPKYLDEIPLSMSEMNVGFGISTRIFIIGARLTWNSEGAHEWNTMEFLFSSVVTSHGSTVLLFTFFLLLSSLQNGLLQTKPVVLSLDNFWYHWIWNKCTEHLFNITQHYFSPSTYETSQKIEGLIWTFLIVF